MTDPRGWVVDDVPRSTAYRILLRKTLAEVWPVLAMTATVSVLLAVLCFRRQRNHGLGGTWFWAPFVLLFGVPAYIGYLAHRSWPARLPCPNCRQLVPRDRPACFACGREFPTPAPKGIEIWKGSDRD